MSNYSTPGVYVEEIASLPPIIAPVGTAIPAFIGYTEKKPDAGTDPSVSRISSMIEFHDLYGGAHPATFGEFKVKKDGTVNQAHCNRTTCAARTNIQPVLPIANVLCQWWRTMLYCFSG